MPTKTVYFKFQYKNDAGMGSMIPSSEITRDRKEAFKIKARLKDRGKVQIVKVTSEVIDE